MHQPLLLGLWSSASGRCSYVERTMPCGDYDVRGLNSEGDLRAPCSELLMSQSSDEQLHSHKAAAHSNISAAHTTETAVSSQPRTVDFEIDVGAHHVPPSASWI